MDGKQKNSFYEYEEVESYELVFYFNYYFEDIFRDKPRNNIFINTQVIKDYRDVIPLIGKTLKSKTHGLRIC